MKLKLVITTALLWLAQASMPSFAESVQDSVEDKVENLLARMTLQEKIGQMNQQTYFEVTEAMVKYLSEADLSGLLKMLNPTGAGFPKPLEEMSRDEKAAVLYGMRQVIQEQGLLQPIKAAKVGSLLNIVDPQKINELQRVAVEESRLGIPLIIGRDVIHGFKTIFPIPLGQAASFDAKLVEEAAAIAAVEAREKGVNWTFAPMVDISRDARWGRIAESLGEDTYLTAELGAAMVRGFQGEDLTSPHALVSCVKHFAGYGAAEGGRDYNTTTIPEFLLHNVYLPPFQRALEAGAQTIMTSFNENDGIPASGSSYLLKEVLRKQWGFDGFVVSDWASMTEMIPHGYAQDKKEVAELAANAGVDMEMFSGTYLKYLEELLAEGKVSQASIDNAVRNILRVKFRMGLFENPYVDLSKPSQAYSPAHLAKAREAAVKSAVLLKNNGILPLKKTQKIAILGPLADAPHDQMGTWVFDGEKEHSITPVQALKTEYKDVDYVYEPVLAYSRDTNTAQFEKAKQAAAAADVAVIFVGEESILSGEAHSLSNLNLIGVQSDLIKAVKSVGKPVVVVVMAGRPLTIERDLAFADAMLYNFHPGTMGGPAILDLLFGQANPSGKLPVTFVREVGQIPMYYNHNNTGRPSVAEVMTLDQIPLEAGQTSLGNTSFYLDSGKDPLFPFGFGLSYSQFEYSDLELSAPEIKQDEALKVRVSIKNNSKLAGTEVVQLYIQDVVGSIVRPVKELKGFQRLALKAGESKTVEFTITAKDLAFYGKDRLFKAEAGQFHVWVGTNSQEGLKASFTLN